MKIEDELYSRAVDLVITGQRASISLLQRSLRIGFSQAAGYMDEMEAVGIVSAHGPKGRDVLVKDTSRMEEMGENEIDWDETELIHVAACALALGGGFFDSINPDVVANKAIEVAKLIIAKARLDSRGKASGVRTHLSTCRFFSLNTTNLYETCSYCDQEIDGVKRHNIHDNQPHARSNQ